MSSSMNTTLNENIRWKMTEDGEHVEIILLDISGKEFSLIIKVGDIWEFFTSFLGATATALAQGEHERKGAPNIPASGVEVAGAKDAEDIVVTFTSKSDAHISYQMNRAVASQLRDELALGLDQARRKGA